MTGTPNADLAYDDKGLNVADPADTLGVKSDYITLVQSRALEQFVGKGSGRALEVGCGFGRMTPLFNRLGFKVLGVDPSFRLVGAAKQASNEASWCVGSLPDLPIRDGSMDLVLLLNVLRPLHLLGISHVAEGIVKPMKVGGRLVVLENLKREDSRYLDEAWMVSFFRALGLRLKRRVAIRSGRWPVIYLIRYGLVPRSMLTRIADWELRRMSRVKSVPRWTYHNVLFEFERSE